MGENDDVFVPPPPMVGDVGPLVLWVVLPAPLFDVFKSADGEPREVLDIDGDEVVDEGAGEFFSV